MRFLKRPCPLLLLCGVVGAVAHGQRPAKKDAPPAEKQKPVVFSDDFQRDSRAQYKVKSAVAWEQGKLTLGEGASVAKDVKAGAVARLEFHFDWPKLTKDRPQDVRSIEFRVKGKGSVVVEIRRALSQGKPRTRIQITDIPISFFRRNKIVRSVVIDDDVSPMVLTVAYRHGLVKVTGDKADLVRGYMKNGSTPLESWVLGSRTGQLICGQVNLTCTPRPHQLTREEQRLHREATTLLAAAYSLYGSGGFRQALARAQQAAQLYKKVLGEAHPDYATAVNCLAVIHWSMGEYAKAEPLYIQARAIDQKVLGEAHPEYATSLNNLAAVYGSMGDYAKAEPLLVQARDIKKKALGEAHPDYATSLNNLGGLYRDMGDYAKAEPPLVQARDIKKKALGDKHPDYARSLHSLATLYHSMGDYTKAELLFLQARDILKPLLGEKHPEYARILISLAAVYGSMGDYAKAEPLYVQARDIKKKALGDKHPDYARSLKYLAALYELAGEYAKAEPLFLQARDILKTVLGEKHPLYASSLHELGGLYESMGRYARAESLYLQALDIRKTVPGKMHPNYASSLDELGLLYESTGEYAKAEPLFLQALGIRKKALGEEHPVYAFSLANVASALYIPMHDYAKAEPLLQQALDIRKKALGEKHPDYATSLNNLAALNMMMGKYAKAERLFVRARHLTKEVLGESHPNYAGSLINLGWLYHHMGDYAKAEPLYIQARDILKKALGETHPKCAGNLINGGLLYTNMADYAKAGAQFQEAFVSLEKSASNVVPALSEAQAMSWMAKHRPPLDAVISNAKHLGAEDPVGVFDWVWQARSLASRLQASRRPPTDASDEVHRVYSDLRRARRRLAQLTLAVPRESSEIKRRRERLNDLSAEKEELERKLAALSSESRRQQGLLQVEPKDLARHLPQGTAVVDITRNSFFKPVVGSQGKAKLAWENHYDAFVLLRADNQEGYVVKWAPLRFAQPINKALRQWRAALQDGGLDAGREVEQARQVLRTRIWEKIEPHLQERKHIVILADGDLHYLPWAALPGRKPGSFLVEEYAISTAQSGPQLYELLTDKRPRQGGLLLAGGVDYDKRQADALQKAKKAEKKEYRPTTRSPVGKKNGVVWQLLPDTLKELEAIQSLWKGDAQPRLLKGAGADEDRLRQYLPSSRYIHLATHGFFADEKYRSMFGHNPQNEQLFGGASDLVTAKRASATSRNPLVLSGVVMAGANLPAKTDDLGLPIGQDGIFTAEEVVNLDLRNTELVVLSACETGLGRAGGGEGVYGLQRAFRLAGARTVVASLWKVDDAATRALMSEFYKNLWQKKLGKLEALRQAQMRMIVDYVPKEGKLRAGFETRPVNAKAVEEARKRLDNDGQGLSPFYWAAFVLAGDWR